MTWLFNHWDYGIVSGVSIFLGSWIPKARKAIVDAYAAGKKDLTS